MTDDTLQTVLARFAGADPTPGGGSAAALAGALAAALAAMVAALTVGKKNYEAVADEAAALGEKAAALQKELTFAIAADAASFDAVMVAMGMAKATDDEKATRKAAMQEALKGATLAPLRVAECCYEATRVAARLLAIGNKNAASDGAVAVLLAAAGGEGALLNVAINLGSIQDADFLAATGPKADALWQAFARTRLALWPAARAAGLGVPETDVEA